MKLRIRMQPHVKKKKKKKRKKKKTNYWAENNMLHEVQERSARRPEQSPPLHKQ